MCCRLLTLKVKAFGTHHLFWCAIASNKISRFHTNYKLYNNLMAQFNLRSAYRDPPTHGGRTLTPLYNSRHPPLDARLSQPRNQQRAPLLLRRPEDREELDYRRLPIRLFNQIHGNTPPRKDRADDPEVSCDCQAGAYALSVGEEAACDSGADGEGGEDPAED